MLSTSARLAVGHSAHVCGLTPDAVALWPPDLLEGVLSLTLPRPGGGCRAWACSRGDVAIFVLADLCVLLGP